MRKPTSRRATRSVEEVLRSTSRTAALSGRQFEANNPRSTGCSVNAGRRGKPEYTGMMECGLCTGGGAGQSCYWNHAGDVGKSFLRQFDDGFQTAQPLPHAWFQHFLGEIGPQVQITVESGREYSVQTEVMDDHLFFTRGWDVLTSGEMLGNNDIGLFTYAGPSSFTLRVFDTHGLELPHTVLWADLFSGGHDLAQELKPTISSTKKSDYSGIDHAAGFYVTDEIRARIDAIRLSQNFTSKMYVGKLTGSQLGSGLMYFSKTFSKELPNIETDAILLYGDELHAVHAQIKKRRNDKVAYITMGWLNFSRRHGLKQGDVCAFGITKGTYAIIVRVYKM